MSTNQQQDALTAVEAQIPRIFHIFADPLRPLGVSQLKGPFAKLVDALHHYQQLNIATLMI